MWGREGAYGRARPPHARFPLKPQQPGPLCNEIILFVEIGLKPLVAALYPCYCRVIQREEANPYGIGIFDRADFVEGLLVVFPELRRVDS